MTKAKLHVQRMSPMGLALLAEYEGVRLTSYRDSAGYPTIGVGHLITDADRLRWQHRVDRKGNYSLSEKEVLDLLAEDVRKVEKACSLINPGPYQNPNIFDSMCSFLFNLGVGYASKWWVIETLKQEQIVFAERKLPLYNRAGGKVVRGLTVRRHNELAWMRKGAGHG